MKQAQILDENEKWVAEDVPIFMRDNHYYFFQHYGWTESGPFETLDECLMSFESYIETSNYL